MLRHVDVIIPSSFNRCGMDKVTGNPVFLLVDAAGKTTHLMPVR